MSEIRDLIESYYNDVYLEEEPRIPINSLNKPSIPRRKGAVGYREPQPTTPVTQPRNAPRPVPVANKPEATPATQPRNAPRPVPVATSPRGSSTTLPAGKPNLGLKVSSANATTAQKIAGGTQVYQQQRAAGDLKGASQTGMEVNKLKYGADFAKPKTPNPLMKDMPGQNKSELDQMRGNAALQSISQSPRAKQILSGTAKSSTANEIGKASLDRSASALEAPAPKKK